MGIHIYNDQIKPAELEENTNLEKRKMEHVDFSRLYQANEKVAQSGIVTETKTDYTGSYPKRYTTKCFIEPKPVPIWYTESVLLHIGSTRRKYQEKIYYKNKLLPCRWSESMTTETKISRANILTESNIDVEKSDIHYISFEPQQIAAGAS